MGQSPLTKLTPFWANSVNVNYWGNRHSNRCEAYTFKKGEIKMNKNELKEIACQGEGCGREAYQEDEDEDYYVCGRCGWAGSSNNPVVVLQRQLAQAQCDLRDCHDLLNNCGYFFENGRWVDSENQEE